MASNCQDPFYDNYRNYYKWYVSESIGKAKIRDIKRIDVITFCKSLINGSSGHKLSLGTVKYINNLINSALDQAEKNDIIMKNPCKDIMKELKAEPQKTKNALTEEEQRLFFEEIKRHKLLEVYEPLFIVAFGTGMRIGEILSLTWKDIDKKNNVIIVNKTMHYRKVNEGYDFFVTTPKTKNSIRTIPILDEVAAALNRQRQQQFMLCEDRDVEISGYKGFIFTTSKGKPYTQEKVNDIIKRVCNNHNKREMKQAAAEDREPILLERFSAHYTRHTFCSRLCEKDVNIKTIQSIMGHADIKTTRLILLFIQNAEHFVSNACWRAKPSRSVAKIQL